MYVSLSKAKEFTPPLTAYPLKTMYRVSLKTVATFIFGISRLPRGLEIPSWTFLKSPFCADLKNIQIFII